MTVEQAYSIFSEYLLEFIAGRPWDVAQSNMVIYSGMMRGTQWLESKGVREMRGDLPGLEMSGARMDAALFLRRKIIDQSKKRIWGIEFTLHPSGKFNIQYDYNKPEGYDDSEDGIGLNEVREALADLGISDGIVNGYENLSWLRDRTEQLRQSWGFGTEDSWNVDMDSGTLSFGFGNERKVLCPVQVIGTLNVDDGSMLWGWDHPSVPVPLRRAAQRLKEFGQEKEMGVLTTRKIACNEADAWAYAAQAARLDGAVGGYRGRSGSAWVYMSFGDPV